MSAPALNRLPKKRSLGVHIKMSTESFPRKMLSISVNRKDGGIMITPHLQNWGELISSRMTVPAAGGFLPDESSYVRTGPDNKPKLHYHRSGMTSVQPQKFMGGEGRKTIHLPSLDELDTVQIFSIAARAPGLLPWDQNVHIGDIIHVIDQPWVRTVLVSGVIHDRKKVPVSSIGGLEKMAPMSMASNHSNTVLIDLSGYGLEAILTLHFGAFPGKLPDFAADFSLVSFHMEHVHSTGAVAIHAGPGIPFAALRHPLESVTEIHNTSSLDPVTSLVQRVLPS